MFEIRAQDLSGFDGLKLVELLRRLLFAEAHAAGVPLFNVAAPLQITFADGGKDAEIRWTGGLDQTDYLPHRDILFQCKASDLGGPGWSRETWTKASQRKGKTRVLNTAVQSAVSRGAAYVGVTLSPLVGDKPDDHAQAIRDGVREAGEDPSKLHAVRVYDGNKLADWATRHQAVALWVKEQGAGVALASFRTLAQWGQRPEMCVPAYVPGDEARFAIGDSRDDRLTFAQFASRLSADMMGDDIRSVRITGPSGRGKTRSVFEAVRGLGSGYGDAMAARTVFCDHRHVGSSVLWDAANSFASRDTPLVLIVDECPRDDAKRLHDLAAGAASPLRVITIDTDSRPLGVQKALAVETLATEESLIRALVTALLPDAAESERNAIAELCDGFPRIAILAARGVGDGAVYSSRTDAAERILAGARLTDPDARRALGCLSLFRRLCFDRPPEAFDALATRLARMSGDELYDHLVTAVEVELAGRYGAELSAQPRPIADLLGLERLAHLRPSAVRGFLETAPEDQRRAMLARIPDLSRSPTLAAVLGEMLGYGGALEAPTRVLTPEGAELVEAFVHVDPHRVAATLHHAVKDMTLDDLTAIGELDGVLGALERLALRTDTFPNAFRALLRLSAAQRPEDRGRAAEIVEQLLHLHLSGTAAPSRVRYAVLDEALEDADPRLRRSAAQALEGGLEFDRFMRTGGLDVLGHEPPATDWAPATTAETVEHIEAALTRLNRIRREGGEVAMRADQVVASALRRLLRPFLMPAIRAYIEAVREDRGFWSEGAKGIGDWLYFDRVGFPEAFGREVRDLFDALLPTDPVDQAVLFCRFWPADLRDPDEVYSPGKASRDRGYSAGRAAALAAQVAEDPDLLSRTIRRLATTPLNTPAPFTDALAPRLSEPEAVFGEALTALETGGDAGVSFLLALLRSLDEAHPAAGHRLADLARASPVLNRRPILIHSALRLTPARLAEVAQGVRDKVIRPDETIPLSFGRAIDDFAVEALEPLLDALVKAAPDGGTWAAVEILSMYVYDRDAVTADEAAAMKRALLAPLGDGRHNGSSGHAYGVLVEQLSSSGFIDDAFAQGLAEQIIAYSQASWSAYGSATLEALHKALATVTPRAPDAVWHPLAAFYEVASRAERGRLLGLIAKRSSLLEGTNAFEAGLLFQVPFDLMAAWAEADPVNRLSFLVGFFPILQALDDGEIGWHPACQRLMDRFEADHALRHALRRRIFPTAWSGSLRSYVEPFVRPLTTLESHSTLGPWAMETLTSVNRCIDADG